VSVLARKIVGRLVEMGELDADLFDIETAEIDRLYSGYWQRSQGAWSWSLSIKTKDGDQTYGLFGSQFSATECAKAPKWDIYNAGFDSSIIPIKEDKK
jgi:hypothetical protein